jgi:peptidoglycan/LPS O-acetylase OafA/YrhL
VRRGFRIHPPYVFGLVFTWLASFAYAMPDPDPGLTAWAAVQTKIHVDPSRLLRSLLFPGKAFGQFPVGWTLALEAIFSLLLPLMFLVARRLDWLLLVAASGLPRAPRAGNAGCRWIAARAGGEARPSLAAER